MAPFLDGWPLVGYVNAAEFVHGKCFPCAICFQEPRLPSDITIDAKAPSKTARAAAKPVAAFHRMRFEYRALEPRRVLAATFRANPFFGRLGSGENQPLKHVPAVGAFKCQNRHRVHPTFTKALNALIRTRGRTVAPMRHGPPGGKSTRLQRGNRAWHGRGSYPRRARAVSPGLYSVEGE